MTYLITGANRGLGLEFVKQLLAAKKNVVAWSRSPEKSPELTTLQKQFPRELKIIKVDISDSASIALATESLTAVDVLINNAGVLLDSKVKFASLQMQTFEDTFKVNVIAPILVTQHLLPWLEKSAHPLVVNISSLMGSMADNSSGGYYAYRMSKAALNMFTKSFSIDYPKIKTLSMHPGWVQTDMGGANATMTVEQSVKGLLRTILEPEQQASGSFVNFGGKSIPW